MDTVSWADRDFSCRFFPGQAGVAINFSEAVSMYLMMLFMKHMHFLSHPRRWTCVGRWRIQRAEKVEERQDGAEGGLKAVHA